MEPGPKFCQYQFVKGARAGQTCGRECRKYGDYCFEHTPTRRPAAKAKDARHNQKLKLERERAKQLQAAVQPVPEPAPMPAPAPIPQPPPPEPKVQVITPRPAETQPPKVCPTCEAIAAEQAKAAIARKPPPVPKSQPPPAPKPVVDNPDVLLDYNMPVEQFREKIIGFRKTAPLRYEFERDAAYKLSSIMRKGYVGCEMAWAKSEVFREIERKEEQVRLEQQARERERRRAQAESQGTSIHDITYEHL